MPPKQLHITDWRCKIPEHWDQEGLGSCGWDKSSSHLVYTESGQRALYVWDKERYDWYKTTNRSSKKKFPGAVAGAAAEIDRLRAENNRLRAGQD